MSGATSVRPIVLPHFDAAALTSSAAQLVSALVTEAIDQRGRCGLALAGGSTPRALYRRLAAADPEAALGAPGAPGAIDWRRVEVWFGDERAVPPDHPASNYRMARETLLDHVPVPAAQVHRIAGELAPAEAARRYAARLAAHLPLDVVLLGMGGDGHTASLFPGGAPTGDATVAVTTSPVEPTTRISLTESVLNGAGAVLFLVSGAAKAARLAEVAAQLGTPEPTLPAARIRPAAGRLYWLLDQAAAAELPAEWPS